MTVVSASQSGIDAWQALIAGSAVQSLAPQQNSHAIAPSGNAASVSAGLAPDLALTQQVVPVSSPTPLERTENNRQALVAAARSEGKYPNKDKALAHDLALSVQGHMPLLALLNVISDYTVRPLLPTPAAVQWQKADPYTESVAPASGHLDFRT